MSWTIDYHSSKKKFRNPVLVEGLPGIGNTGKIVIDFVVEKLKAKKLFSLFSYHFPHSVFVNSKNLVELPAIEVYYKERSKGNDLFFLVGDVQPIDEVSCYEFCDILVQELKKYGVKEMVTLGGIGLPTPPETPKVFITGNDQKLIDKYRKGMLVSNKLHGVVGPIVGVSGLLLGLGERHGVSAVSLLAETYGHPMYIGLKGAKELLKVLKKKLSLRIDMKDMDKEIKDMEEGIRRSEELAELTGKVKNVGSEKEVSYIG